MTSARLSLLLPILSGVALSAWCSLAAARPLALPVRDPARLSATAAGVPAYAGDVLELRLRPAAARRGAARLTGTRLADRLDVPGVDAVARALGGAEFEPEFRGEIVPAPGSGDPDFTAFVIVHLAPGTRLEDALDGFAAAPEVMSASPIAILPISRVPNDSLWSASTWYFQSSRHDIHAPEAWDLTTGDTAIVVALLDTGVLPYHPDLGGTNAGAAGQLWTNWAEQAGAPGVDDDGNGFVDDVRGWDFVNVNPGLVATGEDARDEDPDPNDFAAHGTAVAGFVGALTDNAIGVAGTAWRVRIMPLRIGFAYPGASLGEAEVRMDFVARAVRYATRMGASVINCSFSSLDTDGLGAAVDAATRAGVTVVVAAGNAGGPDALSYLGSRPDAISVAAVDRDDLVAAFSSRYPEIDLSAPGVGLATTWLAPRVAGSDSLGYRQPAYRSNASGTSYSAPLVAGTIALLQARQRELGWDPLHPLAALLRVTETADDLDALNPGTVGLHGSGRLNAFRALTETSGSTAIRLGAAVVGAPLVIPTNAGRGRVVCATSDLELLMLEGAPLDTLAVISLARAPIGSPAAALLPGGRLGIFVTESGGYIDGFDARGTPLAGWPVRASRTSLLSNPALGDIDGDGTIEIVCGAQSGEVWAWHSDGVLADGFPSPVGADRITAPVALGDLDGLAGVEIVAAADDGSLGAIRGDGAPLWTSSALAGEVPGAPIIGRFGPGRAPGVVVTGGAMLHAFAGATGVERAGFPVTLGNTTFESLQPALADINGDGSDEIVIVTTNSVEVRDSSGASPPGLPWPRAIPPAGVGATVLGWLGGTPYPGGPADVLLPARQTLIGFAANGDSLPRFPRPGVPAGSSTIGEVDGDSHAEVVVGSADSLFCLYVYDAGPGSFGGASMPWPTARANAARTGSSDSGPPLGTIDVIAPAAVTDLTAQAIAPGSVRLAWTAPGDDGAIGRAASYDLRRSTDAITESTFEAATPVGGILPAPPAVPETLLVTGLPEGVTIFFALRAGDEAGNVSPISNVVSAFTGGDRIALRVGANPSRLPVAISWHAAPGTGGAPQVIRVYDLQGRRRATLDLGSGPGGVARWNGRDDAGHAVPAGLYFLRFASGPHRLTTRVVLLP